MEQQLQARSGEQVAADIAAEMARHARQLRQHELMQREIGYEGAAIRRALAGRGASLPEAPASPTQARLASWRHRMV